MPQRVIYMLGLYSLIEINKKARIINKKIFVYTENKKKTENEI